MISNVFKAHDINCEEEQLFIYLKATNAKHKKILFKNDLTKVQLRLLTSLSFFIQQILIVQN